VKRQGYAFIGLRRIPANHASILARLEPLVAVVLAAPVLREGLGAAPVAGGLLILAGAVAVVTDAAEKSDRIAPS
jgi:drug/metabolite transporter (DMT)-like permease